MNPLSNHTSINSASNTVEHNQQHRPNKRGGNKYPFPQRLFDLLEKADDGREPEELSSIISWNPNGKHFRVHNRKVFEQIIQKKYFNQSKYASFRRQLNLWGFERIPDQEKEQNSLYYGGCYFHPLFQRHDRRLCCSMSRVVGRNGSKELSSNKVLSSGSSRSLGSDNDSSCSPSIVTTSNSPRNCCNMMEHQPFSSFPAPVCSSLSNGLDGLEPYDRMHDSMTSSSSTNLKTTMMDSNTTLLLLLSSSTSSQEEDSHLIPLGEDILVDEQPQEGYGQDKGDESSPTWTSVDDKEFQELITFLSAKDDNIQKYLFES